MEQRGSRPADAGAIGVTNQRETTVAWDPRTGKAVHNAIVWQDTRVANEVAEFSKSQGQDRYRSKTGLPLATYFSGPKIRWILHHIADARDRGDDGNVLFGTIDCYLLWNLTGGPNGGIHLTEVTNASRTQLMDLITLQWDDTILKEFEIPATRCPRSSPAAKHTEKPLCPRLPAYPSPESSAINKQLLLDRHVSSRARPRTHTEPAASCS